MTRRRRRRRGRAGEAGAELIEFALVFPLLLMAILGIVDFGFLFQRYEVLTNAAREGARVAALPGYTATDVESRLDAYIQTGGRRHEAARCSSDRNVETDSAQEHRKLLEELKKDDGVSEGNRTPNIRSHSPALYP